jgi:hypothetical protein
LFGCGIVLVGCELRSLEQIYEKRLVNRAVSIILDLHHPANDLFEPFPSGRRYRAIKARTERFRCSFYPRAVLSIQPLLRACDFM